MEEPIETPPAAVDPPWVAAALATAPPHPALVQDVLDEAALEASRNPREVARNFRMAFVATVTVHDADGDALHTELLRNLGSRSTPRTSRAQAEPAPRRSLAVG